eukprot:COSAG02_NODE_41707_length_391_cov_4.777397_1_plen_53_part_10
MGGLKSTVRPGQCPTGCEVASCHMSGGGGRKGGGEIGGGAKGNRRRITKECDW